MKSTHYKFISLSLKTLIAAVAFWIIYQKVVHKNELKESVFSLLKLSNNTSTLVLVFLMMFINWTLEIVKWKVIVQKVQFFSFLSSFKAVFSGITVSIFTPNRAGEFGGRIFYLEKSNRLKGIVLSLIGSLSQLLITLIMGVIALLFYMTYYVSLDGWLYYTLCVLLVLLIITSMVIYFNAPLLLELLGNVPFVRKFKEYLHVLHHFNIKDLLLVLFLSLSRYIIFSLQFYILLSICGVNVFIGAGIIMIALTFFTISLIPTITITEIGIRGSAALFFIGLLSDNFAGIMAASFILWLINIVIPALVGIPFIFGLKFFDQDS